LLNLARDRVGWFSGRLVRLAARAFYDDVSMKGDNQPKTSRGDNRGMAVVVLDALTRYWMRTISVEPFVFSMKKMVVYMRSSVTIRLEWWMVALNK